MHTSPHRGSSVEFAEYRRYVPGDDLRRLDWRVYGRTDRFYVKEFEADTNMRCALVVDSSGSMNFGSAGTTKLQYARSIAGSLAYLAIQQGDAVGLTSVAEQIEHTIPPRRTPSHLRGILDTLENTVAAGQTRLVDRLHEFAETIRQRALVVIISDLFVDTADLRHAIEHLRFRKHDIVAFHLLDPQELNFEFKRPTRFVDLELGTSVLADPEEITDRYQRALAEYLKHTHQLVLDSGIDYHQVRIDRDPELVLLDFLAGRTKSRGSR